MKASECVGKEAILLDDVKSYRNLSIVALKGQKVKITAVFDLVAIVMNPLTLEKFSTKMNNLKIPQ